MTSISTHWLRETINDAKDSGAAVLAILERCDAIDRRPTEWGFEQLTFGMRPLYRMELKQFTLRIHEDERGEIRAVILDTGLRLAESPPFLLVADCIRWIEENILLPVPQTPKRRDNDREEKQ